MARRVSGYGLAKLKEWEGFVPYAYDDADTSHPKKRVKPGTPIRGTLTIGYGHTSAAGEPVVFPGMQITEAQAEDILRRDISACEREVENLVKVDLTDNQFAALVSFQLNTGGLGGSTLLEKINERKFEDVPAQFARWNKTTVNGKKVVSQGLVNRRAAEIGLWAKGEQVAPNTVPVQPSTPKTWSKENIGWGVTQAGGAAGVVAVLAEGSGPVQWAVAALMVIGAAVGLYYFMKRRMS